MIEQSRRTGNEGGSGSGECCTDIWIFCHTGSPYRLGTERPFRPHKRLDSPQKAALRTAYRRKQDLEFKDHIMLLF